MMVGERLTSRNRLARMLMQQEQAAPAIQSHTQGLASMLRQGLAGYMSGQDEREYAEAMRAQGLPQLQGMQENPYAIRRAADLQARQTARAQGLEDFETQLKLKQQYAKPSDKFETVQNPYGLGGAGQRNIDTGQITGYQAPTKPTAPKTIKTAEGVFILNPDGTLGTRLGGAKADTEIIMGGELSKDFRPVIDPQTGKQVGAEPIPGGKGDPAYIERVESIKKGSAPSKPSATQEKQYFETIGTIDAAKNSIAALTDALALSEKAYQGPTAEERAIGMRIFGGTEESQATTQLNNLIKSQALDSLKATFGGMPTEGERKILMEIQGSAEMTKGEREAVWKRAIDLARKKIERDQIKAGMFETQFGERYSLGYGANGQQQQQVQELSDDDLLSKYGGQ